jgi:hypothetical protein
MTNYPNSVKYSDYSWILIAKDSGQPMTRGEGIRIFDTYDQAEEVRRVNLVNGYAFVPMPLVK